ncbi:MAG: hypothetical protein KFF72_17625 [Arthrospira sp. SH-MAG29]|nr:hypothetical protein [Arthrospira sp. SH-MAG29]MBS0018142.1 hypothetical protein [Arthrospira sp. SH-MAG29]
MNGKFYSSDAPPLQLIIGGGAGLPKPRWGWMIDGGTRPYNYRLIIGGGAGLPKPRWGWMIDGGGAGLLKPRWGWMIDGRTRPYNYQLSANYRRWGGFTKTQVGMDD